MFNPYPSQPLNNDYNDDDLFRDGSNELSGQFTRMQRLIALNYLSIRRPPALIHCIETGGTFASAPSPDGKRPGLTLAEILENHIPELDSFAKLRYPAPNSSEHFGKLIDSTNAQPEDWCRLAELAQQAAQFTQAKGIVITCGTDTLAYAASALSIILPNPPKAIVLTGAQRAFSDEHSDAPTNFRDAVMAAGELSPGVYVVFNHRIIHGLCASKCSTTSLDAFRSINVPDIGSVDAESREIEIAWKAPSLAQNRPELNLKFDNRVKVEMLIPGYDPKFLERTLRDPEIKGVILMAFGLGGVPSFGERSLTALIRKYAQKKPIVVVSQVGSGGTDLSEYEVGRLAAKEGVISAGALTLEAASFALKSILGRTNDINEIREEWQNIRARASTPQE